MKLPNKKSDIKTIQTHEQLKSIRTHPKTSADSSFFKSRLNRKSNANLFGVALPCFWWWLGTVVIEDVPCGLVRCNYHIRGGFWYMGL